MIFRRCSDHKLEMSEEATICIKCQKEEKDAKKIIECVYCHKSEHFKCKNIIGNAVRKLREQPYFCSLECHEFHQRTTNNINAETKVLNDLRTVLLEVRETKNEMQSVKKSIGEVEQFQSFLSEKLDTFLSELRSLKADHNSLKTSVETISVEHKSLRDRVDYLEGEIDRANRAAVSKNAVILGIPSKSGENTMDVVRAFASTLGCHLPDDAVVEARRLVAKNSNPNDSKVAPIKVCFKDDRIKEDLFAKKKTRGQVLSTDVDQSFSNPVRRIVLRDELTPFGMKLLTNVREQKELAEWKYIWPGRYGAILAKRSDNSKVEIIRNRSDLEKLEKNSSKRARNSSVNSNSPSSPAGPSSKR